LLYQTDSTERKSPRPILQIILVHDGPGQITMLSTFSHSSTQNTRPPSRNPKSEIRNPQSAIRNPQSEIRNPKSAIRNPKSEIRNPKSEIRN